MFDFKQDLEIILKTLDVSSADLCRQLGFDMPTMSNWLNGKFEPDRRSKEDIYSYAYISGLRINEAYQEPLADLAKKQGFVHLYHGSRNGIKDEINLEFSKQYNDLGRGFYLGQTLEQSCMFVSDNSKSNVYSYGLYLNNLKVFEFDTDTDWAITVSHNRGLLNEYESSEKLKMIIEKCKDADVIIAPIADNRMIDIIDEFTKGSISDKACVYALSALDLGKQYVLKTQKAINNLGFIKEYYVCEEERKDYQRIRTQRQNLRQKEIKNFRSKNRDGRYIEELL